MTRYFAYSEKDKIIKLYDSLDKCKKENPNKDYYEINNKIVTRIISK